MLSTGLSLPGVPCGPASPAKQEPHSRRIWATNCRRPGECLSGDRPHHSCLDGLRKAQDEDRAGTKGTLTSIKEGEKLDVFLARGCGQLTVEVCEGVYGKELFHSLKRVGHHAKHELLLLKWPVLITNRLAMAVSGLWWGGDETFTLLASDCQTARADQIELWSPPTEHKIEGRSKPPASFLTWLRYAENHTRVFGAVYGMEHMSERLAFLKALQEAHEEDEHAYPTTYCIKLFEELNAVWVEQVREARRTLCAKLGTENPRMEDLKLIALAPGPEGFPNFRFPRVWDLKDPAGYFQQVVVPRQERALNRLLHRQLHDAATKEKREGNRKTAGTEGETPPETDPKTGAAPRLALTDTPPGPDPPRPNPKNDGKGDKAGGAAAKAYPASKRLTPTQIGLKNRPKVNPKDVDGRIAQLRAQHNAEVTDKAAEGKAKAKGKAG